MRRYASGTAFRYRGLDAAGRGRSRALAEPRSVIGAPAMLTRPLTFR